MIDTVNMNISTELKEQEIFNNMFNISYLLETNPAFLGFDTFYERLTATYKILAEFTYQGFNGDAIIANNQRLVYRRNKFDNFTLGKDVMLYEHNFHTSGGSHRHPSVAHPLATCTLLFISYGLPVIDKSNGWEMKLITIKKIKDGIRLQK